MLLCYYTDNRTKLASRCNTICRFIIFGRMKDKLVVNTITMFEMYWSVNSRVTADFPK